MVWVSANVWAHCNIPASQKTENLDGVPVARSIGVETGEICPKKRQWEEENKRSKQIDVRQGCEYPVLTKAERYANVFRSMGEKEAGRR